MLNDCAVANDVIYCYCTGELCNKDKAKLVRQQQVQRRKNNEMHLRTPATTDDEDLEESSGLGELQRPVPQQTKKQLLTPTDHQLQNEQQHQQQQNSNNNNKKGWMVTLRPATEALNLTTSSPSSATITTAVSQAVVVPQLLLLLLLQLFYNSIMITSRGF